MVAKMMRWRPWPPLVSKKFQVKLVLRSLQGLSLSPVSSPGLPPSFPMPLYPGEQEKGEEREEQREAGVVRRVTAEVRWKGPKAAFSSLRRSVKRNCTRTVDEEEGGVVEWNEEFQTACTLTSHRDAATAFHPWEVSFAVFNSLNQASRNKASVIGTASLNLAEFASSAVGEDIEMSIPLSLHGVATEPPPSLHLALSLLELRTVLESSDIVPRSISPVPLSPPTADFVPVEKDEFSALKAGLRKVKILTEFVSARKSKKACREEDGSEGRSARSEEADYTYPFDTDSLDDDPDEGGLEDSKEGSNIRKSFSYGTLASANYVGGSFYFDMRTNGDFEDWVYFSHRRSDVGCSHTEDTTPSVPEQSLLITSKRSLIPWRKRKLSFRSPKAKGEPLLKKSYGEEGGDDIDFDRRQLSSSDESFGWHKVDEDAVATRSSVSEFGEDNFAIGNWETKEVVSRDGHMKLCTEVFFASIDQRSERAAGESACTALVAVIADWFQTNRGMMPIKSQFDSLIREGSFEWRNLCENEMYRQRFPDKHFDLETVLLAKIRALSVAPEKSFIGFFHPEGTGDDNSGFDFLHGAMSFDSIWDEISQSASESPTDGIPQLFIVSWNDHFFVLKVEPHTYYILDTLGERLYEGCNQAFILKFDENTSICRMPNEDKSATAEAASEVGNPKVQHNILKEGPMDPKGNQDCNIHEAQEEFICRGKESCREYIKSFLAAIPIRELQVDIKKGLMASTPLHHRLQIEFHYTQQLSNQIVPASVAPKAGAVVVPFSLTPTTELELAVV